MNTPSSDQVMDLTTTARLMPIPLYQAKAEFFRTLGHPARIRVLELLSERDHAVHELLDLIEIEPSTLSQQLAVLRRAGLITQHREHGEVRYAISVAAVRDLLLAARSILLVLIEDQDGLKTDLQPAGGPLSAPSGGKEVAVGDGSGRANPSASAGRSWS
jgi:DNA-binding transcriptional ArsR family regulator